MARQPHSRAAIAALKTAALRVMVPKAGRALPALDNIAVAGFFQSPTGLGQSARSSLEALRAAGFDATAIDLTDRFKGEGGLPFEAGVRAPRPGPGILILHVNAPRVSRALWSIGRTHARDKVIVGYWAWELNSVPAEWGDGARFVHEIWAPSRFTEAALARTIRNRPIRIVPHVVPVPTPAGDRRLARASARAVLRVPTSAFVVVFNFAMLSGLERKNPLAAIAAFKLAFGHDPRALLLLRCLDSESYPEGAERVRQAIAGWSNIRLLTSIAQSMRTTIAAADVYLSLHRSEGFGLTLLEAMAAQTPVIATGWSGNTDFMSSADSVLIESRLVPVADQQGVYRSAADRWADPSIVAAASELRRVRDDPLINIELGTRARLAAERFAEMSRSALRSAVHRCAGNERETQTRATPRVRHIPA